MKHLATFLLLFCVTLVLAAQQPAQAFASPMVQTDMAAMSHMDMAAMPDCMAATQKDATKTPCKCGMAGCIAMMASGAPMMLVDGSLAVTASIASERDERIGISAALRGRSTAPEPEPPSALI